MKVGKYSSESACYGEEEDAEEEEESGRIELQTVKKDGGVSVCLKANNLFSRFSYREREDLAYVLLEIQQVLRPVCTTVSRIHRLAVSL